MNKENLTPLEEVNRRLSFVEKRVELSDIAKDYLRIVFTDLLIEKTKNDSRPSK